MATKKYLRSLRVGDKVKFGKMYKEPLSWIIVEKGHNGYPEDSITIQTEEQVACVAFDAAEPYAETDDMKWYGRGRYRVSNINKWLQSTGKAGNWYSAQHSVDHAPTRGYVDYNHYETFAGFLSEFDPQEIGMLMPTTREVPICSYFGSGYYDTVTSTMFLFTDLEYGYATLTKDIIEWHRTKANRTAPLSKDAIAHSMSGRTFTEGENYETMTASGYGSDRERVYHINTSGNRTSAYAYSATGVRPACNLPADTLITSEPDEDGYYTVVVNYAPTEPAPIRVAYEDEALGENTVRSGKPLTISWARSTDQDNNFDHYELERKIGTGDFTQVYSGTNRTFEDTTVYGAGTMTYRVRAVDYYDLTSEWVVTEELTIWSNEAPVLTPDSTDLGTFQMTGPTLSFSYQDPDATSLSLKILVDGKQFRQTTIQAETTEKTYQFSMTEAEWLKIQNGEHTIKVTATDSHGEADSFTATFVKAVPMIQFTRALPVEASELPTEILVRVNGEFPEEGLTVEVCNNAFDETPTWENMTTEFLDEDIFAFTNTAKTAENWGVNIRVTIVRGEYVGEIYVDSVTANFLAGESSTSKRTGLGTSVATEENDAGGQTLIIGG